MKIGGIQKLSLIDYPKKLSCVIFTQGCFFRCLYCHNPSLVLKRLFAPSISEKTVFDFLEKRKNQLDAVVISGGEPTIHKELKDFLKKIKKLNYLIKLDTSGIYPDVLEDLISSNLLDYVAMDIKAPLEKYEKIINVKIDLQKIKQSIKILKNSKIDFEFRTTAPKELLSKEDFINIAKTIKGAKKYFIQNFVLPKDILNKKCSNFTSYNEDELNSLKLEIEKYVKTCKIR